MTLRIPSTGTLRIPSTGPKEHPIIRLAKASAVAMKVLTEIIARVEELGLDIQDISVSAEGRSYGSVQHSETVNASVQCYFHDYRIERAVMDLYRRGYKLQRGGYYGENGRQRNISFMVDTIEVRFTQRERDAKKVARDIARESENPEEYLAASIDFHRTAQEA
tara:strand:- start:536 stop:1027 length:492 start_codon:yes stop_codon:yes gene_type:complete